MDKVYRAVQLASQPHKLYLVVLSSDATNEKFLKIGITSQTIKQRFCTLEHYEVQSVYEIDYPTGLEARGFESMLKEQALEYSMKYTPRVDFDGKTECYKIKHLQDLIDVFSYIEDKGTTIDPIVSYDADLNVLMEMVMDLQDAKEEVEDWKDKYRQLELHYIQMTEQYWGKI